MSPIKGLRVGWGFPRLGYIKKGAPYSYDDMKAHRPMKELPYFRLDTTREDVRKAWDERVGREPRVLHVILPYAEIGMVWDNWQEVWDGTGLIHRCDGETMVRYRLPDGKYSDVSKPCPYFEGQKRTRQDPGCAPVGRLRVIVTEVLQAEIVGYLELHTGGWTDCRRITSCLLEIVEKYRVTDLTGLPCVIRRQEEEVSYLDDKGAKHTSKHHMVYLEPSAEWVRQRMALEHARLFSGELPELESEEMAAEGGVVDETDEQEPEPPADEPHEAIRVEYPAKDLAAIVKLVANCEAAYGIPIGIDDCLLAASEKDGSLPTPKEAAGRVVALFSRELADSLCEDEYDFDALMAHVERKCADDENYALANRAKHLRAYFPVKEVEADGTEAIPF